MTKSFYQDFHLFGSECFWLLLLWRFAISYDVEKLGQFGSSLIMLVLVRICTGSVGYEHDLVVTLDLCDVDSIWYLFDDFEWWKVYIAIIDEFGILEKYMMFFIFLAFLLCLIYKRERKWKN